MSVGVHIADDVCELYNGVDDEDCLCVGVCMGMRGWNGIEDQDRLMIEERDQEYLEALLLSSYLVKLLFSIMAYQVLWHASL